MKSSVITFEEEAQLSLTIDGALYGAKINYAKDESFKNDGIVPMEIGNVEAVIIATRELRRETMMLVSSSLRSVAVSGSVDPQIMLK